MKFLLDTNVLSELIRLRPDSNVTAWFDVVDEDATFISVISIAEMRRGASLLDRSSKRHAIENWLHDEIVTRFGTRTLDVTPQIANAWGGIMADAKRRRIGLETMDCFIAASAQVHSLAIATRNERDFKSLNIPLINPWLPLSLS